VNAALGQHGAPFVHFLPAFEAVSWVFDDLLALTTQAFAHSIVYLDCLDIVG